MAGWQKRYLEKLLVFFGQVTLMGVLYLAIAFVSIRSGWSSIFAGLSFSFTIASGMLLKKVYEVSVPRSIGMVLLLGVAGWGGAFATEEAFGAMPWTTFLDKSEEDQKSLVATWQAQKQAAPPPANGTAPSIPVPAAPATLLEVYATLQKERAQLDPKDSAAVMRFNEHVATYNAMKSAAAPPPPDSPAKPVAAPATPSPTPKAKRKNAPRER